MVSALPSSIIAAVFQPASEYLMDITTLPFDANTMLAGLRPWVECESPTFDAARVNAMMDLVSRECGASGIARVRRSGSATRRSPAS
jgi:hypothetical protein